jgi:coatomer protein complex subunit gamma
MVIFEAARAIVGMPDVSQRELAPAVTVLQLFLTSSKPVLRFAAVRSLNKARSAPSSAAPAGSGIPWPHVCMQMQPSA